MPDINIMYADSKIIIHFEKQNEQIKDYLLYGLEFRMVDDRTLVKGYNNTEQIKDDIALINQKITALKIDLSYDLFLAGFVKVIEAEVQELKDSILIGKVVKDSEPQLPELPANFYRSPMPFQRKSINHIIAAPNTANFSVPGSGKTLISLAAYSALKSKGIVDHLLVVGPLSAFSPWEEEFTKCFKVAPRSIRITGMPSIRTRKYENSENVDLFLITYHMLQHEEENLQNLLKKHKFLMVLDESHHVKNFHEGIHASTVRKLGKHAKRRLILSGTPVPNSLEDLWSQFTFLWPNENLLGTKSAFKAKIIRNPSFIKNTITPLFIRINKDELKIPPPKIEKVKIKLEKEHYEFYYELARSFLYDASKISSKEEKIKFYKICMAWLLQSIDDPNKLMLQPKFKALVSSNPKLIMALSNYNKNPRANKIIYSKKLIQENLSKGRKTLLWTYFVKNIVELKNNELKFANPLLVYGAIPNEGTVDEEETREKNIGLFKQDSTRKLLIANPAACAESISLHEVCKDAIYLDRTFNCAQYLQSLDRIHRIGIVESPDIKILLAKDTFDKRVDERLNEKVAKMLELLDDPFAPINLETSAEDLFGEINEEMRREEARDLELFEDELRGAAK